MATSASRRVVRRKSQAAEHQKALKAETETTPTPTKPAVQARPTITEIPGLPFSGRPFTVPNGEGPTVLNENAQHELGGKTVLVEMDAGAFRWLWELTEAKGVEQYARFHGWLDPVADAAARATTAMREAGHHHWPSHYQPPAKAKAKRVVRRKTEKVNEEKKNKRVVVRKKK